MIGEPLRPVPKPTRAPKEPKRLRAVSAKRQARIDAGEERPGMKRSPFRRVPPAPLIGEAAGRMEFARQFCVVSELPGHFCRGDIQASHERNPPGGLPTGTGRKEDPRKTCGMCAGGHNDEWHRAAGPFAGWTKEQRHDFMRANYERLNVAWDALTPEQREWWAGRAEEMRRRRAEALRSAL